MVGLITKEVIGKVWKENIYFVNSDICFIFVS